MLAPHKVWACWPASLQCVLDESGSLSSTQAFAIINPRTSLRNPRLRNWAAQIPIYKFLSEGAHCQTGSVGHARSIAPRFYRQEIKSSSPNLTAQEWSRWTDLSVIPVDFCMNSYAFLWFHLISSDWMRFPHISVGFFETLRCSVHCIFHKPCSFLRIPYLWVWLPTTFLWYPIIVWPGFSFHIFVCFSDMFLKCPLVVSDFWFHFGYF